MSLEILVVVAVFGIGPAPDNRETRSKRLFREGEAAMRAKDYATAVAKYKAAYREMPHLHLFTYNIASAAELVGDCGMAMDYYQRFYDLAGDHPRVHTAQRRLRHLRNTCAHDEESREELSAASIEERAQSREERAAQRTLRSAVVAVEASHATYEGARRQFPSTPVFRRAARRKKRHATRLGRLARRHGVEVAGGDGTAKTLGSSVEDACTRAAKQEERTADALEEALQHHDDRRLVRALDRAWRSASGRQRRAFESCAGRR